MKEASKLFLDMAASGQLNQYLEQFGVHERDRTNLMGIIARLTIKAQDGDEKAARLLLELSGDLPKKGKRLNLDIGIDDVVIYLPEVEKLPDD
jgi:hypothetical protein